VDFEVRQDEQSTQELGGAGGVGAELGESAPVLEVGEAVFDGCASGGQDPVGLLFAGGELAGAGGLEAGDDPGVVGVVVQAEEAEVRQSAEAGVAEVGEEVVAAGGGDVVGAAGPGRGDPDQATAFIGEGEEVQAVSVVFDAPMFVKLRL
jgi:hypothetical protein